MEPCLNEPLNLCTKNSPRTSEVDACDDSPVHRTIIDYDEVCLATRVNDSKENCDKNSTATTTTNGTSTPPSRIEADGAASYDGFVRPCDGETGSSLNGNFDWQSKEKNPNLLIQQQYFLLHQHQQHQQQLMNNAPDGSAAKMHLDKYMKLTNRYLDTMSPFFQYFTPFMSQSQAGQPSTSVQAAATAAATLLLTSNLNQQHQNQPANDECDTPPETPDSNDGSGNGLLSQDNVRYFLHKLIEHNFLQQLQQQQQINDLINNNNHQNTNNNSKSGSSSGYNGHKEKSPSSNERESPDYYNHPMMSQPNSHQTKTFLEFLKNAAAAQSANAMNQSIANRNHQSYKRSSIEHHHNSKNSSSSIPSDSAKESIANDKKKPHIKKPLNAFMLYMKEMRAQVVAECTLKESAAINQILGRKWHSLSREEQSIYYEKARQERQLHMELYPGWSARDNYGYGSKKKKRKKDRSPADSGGNSMKKCRARYGLDQQNQWCKPCRRKKKCIRYKEAEESRDLENHGSDDNLGSCGSVDDAHTPDDDTESLNQSMSSPGGLSGLSSLQSPSTSLASPINLLASPSTPNPIMSHHHDEHQMVASLVNQLQRNKPSWDGKHQNHQKSSSNGMLSQDEIKKEQLKLQQQQQANDVQIKSEPMDQSLNHHHLLQQQQQHRLDPLFYDKFPTIHRNPVGAPVGANPRDINNPLSVNQLTRRDFQPNMGGGGGYYSPFQKPLMTHPLAHPHHLAQFHAANFQLANFQLAAAAAAAQQQAPGGGKDAGPSNGTHHRNDDGNAISVT